MSERNSKEHVAPVLRDGDVFGENIKCTLIGDECVGKTSMLFSYQTDTYPSQYVPTVLDTYSKSTTYNSKLINLQLYDIGGKEHLDNSELQGRIGTDVFLLCFSCDDRKSFDSVSSNWLSQITMYWMSQVSSGENGGVRDTDGNVYSPIIILVGCKSDTKNTKALLHEIRLHRRSGRKDPRPRLESKSLVSSKEALSASKRIKAHLYMECCARNGTGIKEVFNAAINAVLQRRNYLSSNRYILK